MAKDVRITPDSKITIKDDSKLTIKEGSKIAITEVKKIAPVAAHIKEINHIDPLRIEELYLNELKNIEPIRIEKFNVTNLPTVNIAVRQIPSVDMNIRRLPPVSLGVHQDFFVPSNYLVRARLFGIEFFRMQMSGQTQIMPTERYRREQSRTPNRSFPLTATAGNPAIPTICREKSSEVCYHPHIYQTGSRPQTRSPKAKIMRRESFYNSIDRGGKSFPNITQVQNKQIRSVHSGKQVMNFNLSESNITQSFGESSVSTGG